MLPPQMVPTNPQDLNIGVSPGFGSLAVDILRLMTFLLPTNSATRQRVKLATATWLASWGRNHVEKKRLERMLQMIFFCQFAGIVFSEERQTRYCIIDVYTSVN